MVGVDGGVEFYRLILDYVRDIYLVDNCDGWFWEGV